MRQNTCAETSALDVLIGGLESYSIIIINVFQYIVYTIHAMKHNFCTNIKLHVPWEPHKSY